MDITSTSFFVFLSVIYCLYYLVFFKCQWVCLLFVSLFFYFAAAKPFTFVYVFVTTLSIYYSTILLRKNNGNKTKRTILSITLIINIAILGVLKYSNLFINTINALFYKLPKFQVIGNTNFLASLAISFYTLQMVSYLLDVYWSKIEPIKNPLKLLLYCIYFPQMVSGPISRYEELSDSLFRNHLFDYYCFTSGLIRIAWGLVKKLAISNRIAIIVDYIWENQSLFNGQWIWLSAFLYIFQIYTDFSGCMDIVIGVSKGFGITLPENFLAPFFSRNIQEFWRRWHITLGTWLRDYIMVPLQRSKMMSVVKEKTVKAFGKKWGRRIPTYLSMLVLWLAMGLWHGNSWKYILGEGLWFWIIIVISNVFDGTSKKIKKSLGIEDGQRLFTIFQIVRTLILYSFGMLFFRASSLTSAFGRIRDGLYINYNKSRLISVLSYAYNKIGIVGCVIALISFLTMAFVDHKRYEGHDILEQIRRKPVVVRWLIYFAILLVICLSVNVTKQSFAYAQF